MWIIGLSRDPLVCQGLVFSHGVEPVYLPEHPPSWREFAQAWLKENQIPGTIAMLAAGPSPREPDANYRIEFLRVGNQTATT
jgi:pyruvate kinase